MSNFQGFCPLWRWHPSSGLWLSPPVARGHPVLLQQSGNFRLAGIQVGGRLAGGMALPNSVVQNAFLEIVDQFNQVQPGIIFDGRPAVILLGQATRGQNLVQHLFVMHDHPLLENVFQFVQFADDACLLGVIDDEEIWETPVTTDMLYPHRNLDLPDPHPDMPSRIKEDYEEAQNVFEFSSRSATALLRLVIQKLCVELGEKGKNLNRDIANLVKGGLPRHIQQALDVVRVIGNESVHPGTIDVRDDPETAKELFLLVNEIVDDRFGRPKREALIETRYKSLPKSKLDEIEVRDAK